VVDDLFFWVFDFVTGSQKKIKIGINGITFYALIAFDVCLISLGLFPFF